MRSPLEVLLARQQIIREEMNRINTKYEYSPAREKIIKNLSDYDNRLSTEIQKYERN